MRKRQANIKTQFDRAPVIAFLAHVDTATGFDASGVKPIVHRAYAGGAIVLPDDPAQVFSPPNPPYWATRVGDDIGTASINNRFDGDAEKAMLTLSKLRADTAEEGKRRV